MSDQAGVGGGPDQVTDLLARRAISIIVLTVQSLFTEMELLTGGFPFR
jgi:hypothetical protein